LSTVRVLILRAAGINCDLEAQYAWELAGAQAERVHVRSLLDSPALLDAAQVLTIPGGFSYGDDVAAGRILAAQLERHLADRLRDFVASGRLLLGICNGFQVLVKSGLLPGAAPGLRSDEGRVCTIADNDPPGFQDRWVWLQAGSRPCAFLDPGARLELPIAHGEGRVVFRDAATRAAIVESGQAVLRFVPPPPEQRELSGGADLGPAGAPYNPNGSEADVAGLCDASGRVFGLMPHPERFVRGTQHPSWTSRPWREEGDGLVVFRNAVACFG
jgi:phosphoribosylformylglycinamidine synthase I